MPESEPTAEVEQLRARGFVTFEGLFDAERAAGFGAQLVQMWRELGEPTLLSREDIHLAPGVHVSPVGLTWAGIVERVPGLAELLLNPRLLALFETLLGPGFELEYGAGVMSDRSRGFFFWHHHVGGIDADDVRHSKVYPTFDRVERLGCTLYASPLDDRDGVMLVWPRAVVDSTAPPYPPAPAPWPGATELRVNTGSVVVFDQGTWHAVTPMQRGGHRAFFGFFVRRAGLGPFKRVDAGCAAALARDPALARAYARAEGGHT